MHYILTQEIEMAYADLTPAEQQEIKDYWDLYYALGALLREEELYGLDQDDKYKLADMKREMKERFDE
jgi:hypothetical protein